MGQQTFCQEDCIQCNVFSIDSKKKNYIDISNSSGIVLLSDLFLSLKRSRAQSRKVTTTSALGTEYYETTFVTITFTFTIIITITITNTHTHTKISFFFFQVQRVRARECKRKIASFQWKAGIREVTFLYYKRPDKCIKGGFSFRHLN